MSQISTRLNGGSFVRAYSRLLSALAVETTAIGPFTGKPGRRSQQRIGKCIIPRVKLEEPVYLLPAMHVR